MEALILAGGFAKRLRPLSEYIPKPLFPIGGVPLLNYIVEKVEELKPRRIIVSTNKRFENHFRYWLQTLDPFRREKIDLIVEPTNSEKEKFGAIYGMYYAIKDAWVEDDLVIVAGDNLFDFDLRKIRRFMKEKGSIVLGLYDVGSLELARNYGVVQIDDNYRVVDFQEKPGKPKSTLISTGIYGVPEEYVGLVEKYLGESSYRDAIGKFVEWLVEKIEVYGYPYQGVWFDIGTFDSYVKANEFSIEKGLYRKWI